jgi:hypothetical protein
MLAGTFSTSASSYLQTIFRVQSPAKVDGCVKDRCYVFDFAPDRTLKMVAEASRISTRPGKGNSDERLQLGEFLNFCPVISVKGSSMKEYDVNHMMRELKKSYVNRVVHNGFDDPHIYNDELLKLTDVDINDFEELKKVVGSSKQQTAFNRRLDHKRPGLHQRRNMMQMEGCKKEAEERAHTRRGSDDRGA